MPAMDQLQPDSALSLTVGADSVAVRGRALSTMNLPITDEVVELPRMGRTLEAKAKWDGPVLVIERGIEDGPKIVDEIEAAAGDRMVVTRKIELPNGPTVELTLAYDRPSE